MRHRQSLRSRPGRAPWLAGREVGSLWLQVEFAGEVGPYFGWLQVDPDTLEREARAAGWVCEILMRQEDGEYLARLTPQVAA